MKYDAFSQTLTLYVVDCVFLLANELHLKYNCQEVESESMIT